MDRALKLLTLLVFGAAAVWCQATNSTAHNPNLWRSCTATVKANCNPRTDASGNLAMVATLPTSGVTTVSATSLTLDATHNGHILKSTAGTDATYTLNTGIGLAGYSLLISQRGAGTVTVTAGAGVTIRQRQSYTKTAGLYAVATLVCDVDNDCILAGDLQ